MKLNLQKSFKKNSLDSTFVLYVEQSQSKDKPQSRSERTLKSETKAGMKARMGRQSKEFKGAVSFSSDVPSPVVDLVKEAMEGEVFCGKFKESLFFRGCKIQGFKNILVIGLGEINHFSSERSRVVGAITFQQLKANKIKEAVVHLPSVLKSIVDLGSSEQLPESDILAVKAFCEGLLLADYNYDELKTSSELKKKKKSNLGLTEVTLLTGDRVFSSSVVKAVKDSETLSECIHFSRRLGDMPGNLMTPEILAHHALKAAKGTKLKVTVWNKERIKKEKMGGLLGVSLGSAVDPRFIILEYQGAEKSKKPVVFVGKGLTFDSGGISIKPAAQMDEMRYDMCGGANVIGTLLALAKLNVKVNAIGLVPATENMPGPLANKPGDVLVLRNGKTAEVLNTDAEGRLILADALVYASEKKPAVIFDVATLTGAIVVSLSNIYTGFFTRNKELRGRIENAAEVSGELLWPMPLHDFHLEDIKGTYADLANISSYKGGGSSTAAAFLEQFVDESIPWAHFDIAGTAWACGNRFPYCPAKGASGVIIRTFIELAKTY